LSEDEVVDVKRPIASSDVGKALKQAYQKGRPAVCFENNGTESPLVCGVYADRKKALLAFQAEENAILQKVLDGLDNPIEPVLTNGNAPCHDVVITDDMQPRV
jgi:2,5-furandicarboxylate decarboxylase 1